MTPGVPRAGRPSPSPDRPPLPAPPAFDLGMRTGHCAARADRRPARRPIRLRHIGAPRQDALAPSLALTAIAHEAHVAAVCEDRLPALAAQLGVSVAALLVLEVGWLAERRAWTWPMLDARGDVVGIRLRRRNGDKRAIFGSRNGLFWVPPLTSPVGVLLPLNGE